MLVLQSSGYPVNLEALEYFREDDHFSTFPGELNPSIYITAKAIQVLYKAGEPIGDFVDFLLKRQNADGRWPSDKWHSSWLYTTLDAVITLIQLGEFQAVQAASRAILVHQNDDGGWGSTKKSTITETAYGLLALYVLWQEGLLNEGDLNALRYGYRWLLSKQSSKSMYDEERLWIGKEAYRARRVDRSYVLATLLAISSKEHELMGLEDHQPQLNLV